MGQEHLVLLGYADSWSNITLGAESFIPLLVTQSVQTKTVDGKLLFVNYSFGLIQDGLLDSCNYLEGFLGRTCFVPTRIIFHFVQKYWHTFPHNHLEGLSSLFSILDILSLYVRHELSCYVFLASNS